jgi:glucose/arabinose dehydrogenase
LATVQPIGRRAAHPLHALLFAFPVALFSSALLSDITYLKSAEIQWSNFASWMITGGLIFGAPVMLWAALSLLRRRRDGSRTRAMIYFAPRPHHVDRRVDQRLQAQPRRLEFGGYRRSSPVDRLDRRRACRRLASLQRRKDRPMNARFLLTALLAATTLSACNSGDESLDQTGASPKLPAVDQTLVPPMKIAKPQGWNGELPSVPEGFTITAVATGLKIPRQILVLPNGDILVAEGSGGHAPKLRPKDVIAGYIKSLGKSSVKGGDRITLLRDANGDGKADLRTTFIKDLDAPYGLALVNGSLYVANQGALLRFAYSDGQTSIAGKGEEVTKLPSQINHHWTKSLAASPDGSKLYVGIGSNSNIGERGLSLEEDRAVIWEIDPTTGSNRIFVSGIRNPTALAFEPSSSQLWAVVNERDELGAQLVPDYLTSVREGSFYGWPYSYWGKHLDPRVHPKSPNSSGPRSHLIMRSGRTSPRSVSALRPVVAFRVLRRAPSSANMGAGTASISQDIK